MRRTTLVALAALTSLTVVSPALAQVELDSGTGVNGDGPADPTAGYDETRVGNVRIGTATGPNAYGVAVQIDKESRKNPLAGRFGLQYQDSAGKIEVYGEDYAHSNPKADAIEDVNDATGCALFGTYADGECGRVGKNDTPDDAFLLSFNF